LTSKAANKSPFSNRQSKIGLALALLKARVFLVDNKQLALPAYDFAIGAALFDGCSNLHG
jgi:hypothetical protein